MKDIIQNKLERYQVKTAEDELNALKEITQEVVLHALAKTDFFQKAQFVGGTCLRILHRLDRFSEDLDFSLNVPTPDFKLMPYLEEVGRVTEVYGYRFEISGKDAVDSQVRARFLKDDSIKKVLALRHAQDGGRKIQIKIEVDVNPPVGAQAAVKYCDFPTDFAVSTQELGSLFAGKLHALLCRPYLKGRDWFDFNWYVARGVSPNLPFLSNALKQQGTWKGQDILVDSRWLENRLGEKIDVIRWAEVVQDVARFLTPDRNAELRKVWSRDFFRSRLEKMRPHHSA